MPRISISHILVLAVLVGAVFWTGLGSAKLWDRDEPRNSRASHEMLARGDWIVPTFNGQLRDHKPILLYWAQMTSYVTLGESEFAARFPSTVAAILAILAVGWLTSRMSGVPKGVSREGFWAAGALATSLLFVMAGRAATPDACLIAFSTLGIVFIVAATLNPSPPFSTGKIGTARWLPALCGYAMLGLAALAKGPVGIILPLAVVHLWWLLSKTTPTASAAKNADANGALTWMQQTVRPIWSAFHPLQLIRSLLALRTIPGLIVCLLIAVPWYVMVGMETDGAFLRGFFFNHNLGRAMNSMEGHGGSIFYYPVAFLVGTFPWSLWTIPTIIWAVRAQHDSPMNRQIILLSAAWIAVYVSAFSMASTKLPSYITPCYPGAAMAIGLYWSQFERAWRLPTVAWRYAAYCLTVAIGCGIAGALWWLAQSESMPTLVWVASAGVVIALAGLVALVCDLQKQWSRVPGTWLAAAATFQVVLFGFGTATVDEYRQDLALLRAVNPLTDASNGDTTATTWISIGGMEPSWVHYLDTQIHEVLENPKTTASWDSAEQHFTPEQPTRLIVVGEDARAQFTERQQQLGGYLWEESGSCDRFLKPGTITVFEPTALVASDQPNSGEELVETTANNRMVPAQLTGHRSSTDIESSANKNQTASSDDSPFGASPPDTGSLVPQPAQPTETPQDQGLRNGMRSANGRGEYENPLRPNKQN